MHDDSVFPRSDFHTNGITVLRAALAPAVLRNAHQRASALRDWAEEGQVSGLRKVGRRGDPSRDELPLADRTWGVNEITRPALHDPHLINLLAAGAIGDCVEDLIAQPRAWGLKLLWAPRARPYTLRWHRDIDWSYDALLPYKPAAQDHLQYNIALAEDNAFSVVPGSHRRPLNALEQQRLAADPHADLPGAQRVHLHPGDVLIMDAHALHCGHTPAAAPRLTLHYSVQAQWVPLLPWGEAEHFSWICSEPFISSLEPRCQEWYRRLTTAQPCERQCQWLEDAARAQGWDGVRESPMPAVAPQRY